MTSKIVLVASTGPMASAVVAALVEKFGYAFFPMRDYGLNESLVAERKRNEILATGFRRAILANCKPIVKGGVNVEDRDASPPLLRIDPDKVWPALDKIDHIEGIDLVDLYQRYRQRRLLLH